ncbi:MAG TPA: dihydropteroate synthase [Acidimicrobiales bacterium]|nr:dihydropteroate synthase [Acidimicrobiales bacterium]
MQVARPLIMGVVNVTPDSFSDGGRYLGHAAAVAHGRAAVADGADWIDVGGESTRPRAEPVPVDEELRRVLPVVEALAAEGVAVSIDTRHAEVARRALAAGARMVNDVSASLAAVAAAAGGGFVAVHMLGDPRTMQDHPRYGDVVSEVRDFLVERADAARAAGVGEVWIDPGIGFGKAQAHNLALLAHLDVLVATGFPVLVGTSRKQVLGRLAARADARAAVAGDGRAIPPPTDRLEGSVATAVWAMRQGVSMVRVHDVAATVAARAALAAAAPAA